jgi:hypothetical protein
MRSCRYTVPVTSVALAILWLMVACTPTNLLRSSEVEVDDEGPQVEIAAPANHGTVSRGSTIAIRVLINDPKGIASIQLLADEQPVTTVLPSAPPVTQLTQEIHWTPDDVGPHDIKVAAQNNTGQWGYSEPITLYVVDLLWQETVIAVQLATATPDPFAVVTPLPTSPYTPPPPFTPTPTPCNDNSGYLTDVTVPDGKQFEKGTAFDKIWRLRNIGTCIWNTDYELIFLDGSQLGGSSPTALAQTVLPGDTVDITVPMMAPDALGTYSGRWQMRNADGVKFGAVMNVRIEVRLGLNDPPRIDRFEVVPNAINQGQPATIYWEYVNGTFARLYPGEQVVGPTGSLVVSPNGTTSYRLEVSNGAGTQERTVTLVVQSGPAPPPAPASPLNLTTTAVHTDGFDFSWTDASSNEQGFRLYNVDTQQIMATFPSNVVSAPISGLACGTSYRFYLVAFNAGGQSWPSNTVQDTTSACGG